MESLTYDKKELDLFYKWKPGVNFFIPLKEKPIHYLEGAYNFLHPGYMNADIYLDGKEFLAAQGLITYSCAHAFYSCLMTNKKKAEDVATSSSVILAKSKAEFYKPREDWKIIQYNLMEDIIYKRFHQNFNDKRKLQNLTQNKAILPRIGKTKPSTKWGVSFDEDNHTFIGFNLIGKALMRYRSWLINTNPNPQYTLYIKTYGKFHTHPPRAPT